MEIIKILLEYGADINFTTGNDETVLSFACKEENLELVKFFIENGAKLHNKLLHNAAEKENYELLVILLKANANPNIRGFLIFFFFTFFF